MLSKKNINKIDSNMLIFFSDLNCCSFFHQLYKAFIMMKKSENFNNDEYFNNEIKVSKIMIVFIF